jgi:anti-sigma-K factor RskA
MTQAEAGQPNCERLRELLPAYSVGALEADEAREVETLMPLCPDVAADARAYARLARALHYAAPDAGKAGLQAAPSDELRARILKEASLAAAFLQQSRATTALPPPPDSHSSAPPLTLLPPPTSAPRTTANGERTTRRPSALRVGLGIAAALLLISNLYWIAQVQSLDADARAQTARLDQQAQLLAVIAAPDARAVDLVAEDGRALARVSWRPGGARAVLQTAALPTLAADRAYQAWLIPPEGAPISAGVFQPDADGSYTLIVTADVPFEGLAAFGISEEPAGGSAAPTSTPLAVGALT